MATTYLKRLPASNGSNTTGTLSAWLKRETLSAQCAAIAGQEGTNDNQRLFFGFWGDGTLALQIKNAGTVYEQNSVAVFRDPAAWYHIVARLDTTNGVAQDRIQLWVNGEKITTYTTNDTFPSSLDIKLFENTTACETLVGARKNGLAYQNISGGSMSHVHVIDGTAYNASTFGETDATSGIWKIKTDPTVTYGTNGFWLKMEDRTNLDLDSGTNNFTDFITAGTLTATYDNSSNNFCTLNPLNSNHSGALTNGNTTGTTAADAVWRSTFSTIGATTGKYYWEGKCVAVGAYTGIGIASVENMTGSSGNSNFPTLTGGYAYQEDGVKNNQGSESSYGNTYTTGDIIGCAFDSTNGNMWFSKDGVWQNSATIAEIAAGTTANAAFTGITTDTTYLPTVKFYNNTTWSMNFGNGYFGTTAVVSTNADDAGVGSFEYDVPAGYYALCTKNIKTYG